MDISWDNIKPPKSLNDKTKKGEESDPDSLPLATAIIHGPLKRYGQDTKWRNRLAWWVVWVTSIWMLTILVILLIEGSCSTFDLEKEVLITLLATTTANVLGLPLIVLRGIFSEGKHR